MHEMVCVYENMSCVFTYVKLIMLSRYLCVCDYIDVCLCARVLMCKCVYHVCVFAWFLRGGYALGFSKVICVLSTCIAFIFVIVHSLALVCKV